MAESWRTEKKRRKIKVLAWPAIPPSTVDEVYAGVDEKRKEYALWVESAVRQRFIAGKPGSLNGIRVLDMTANQSIGHWCSSHFSELGADVIMVVPIGGDPQRKLTPFGREESMFTSKDGEKCGALFLAEARNKLSVTLNVETDAGQELLKAIIPQVDIFIEDAAPGHYDSLGIGYRQLSEINPRLAYLWVGQRGPLKDQPGAMAALCAREKFLGHGRFVECTGAEAVIRIIDYNWAWNGMDGSVRPRYGNWDLAINIYAGNPCADGQIMAGGGHDRLWFRIWRAAGPGTARRALKRKGE